MRDLANGVGTSVTEQEALDFHSVGRPGKLEITPTKPMATQRDLSLAYPPGVAVSVRAIAADPAARHAKGKCRQVYRKFSRKRLLINLCVKPLEAIRYDLVTPSGFNDVFEC